MSSLANQTVLVVGGSSGLGFAVAKAAQREGARIILSSSNEARITAAIDRLGGATSNVSGGVIDLNTEAGVTSFFEKHGAVDHVVYTAGDTGVLNAKFPGLDLDKSRGIWDIRYWGVLNVAKIAPKYIHVSLTITGGASSHRPFKEWSALAPIVGAMPSLVRALSIDLAPLRVNVITPGLVDSEMWDVKDDVTRKAMLDQGREKTLVGHVAKPDEIADAYLFAIKCKYFTGQEVVVDGGLTLL